MSGVTPQNMHRNSCRLMTAFFSPFPRTIDQRESNEWNCLGRLVGQCAVVRIGREKGRRARLEDVEAALPLSGALGDDRPRTCLLGSQKNQNVVRDH